MTSLVEYGVSESLESGTTALSPSSEANCSAGLFGGMYDL